MRQYVLIVYVIILIYLALKRDWYYSLCGICLLTATMGHPDMPRMMFGIRGLNYYNIVLVCILYAWLRERSQTGYVNDAPLWAKRLFYYYCALVVFAWLYALTDLDAMDIRSRRFSGTFNEYFFEYGPNTFRFFIPAILWFEGARTRRRVIWGLIFILVIPNYYAFKVTRTMPWEGVLKYGNERARRRIGKQIGFHANSVALCTVVGTWSTLAMLSLCRRKKWLMVIPLAFTCLGIFGTSLGQSRAGYYAIVGSGFIMGIFIYRSLLVILPIGLSLVPIFWPGVVTRFYKGAAVEGPSGEVYVNIDERYAGRIGVFWDTVVEEIWKSPVYGQGRRALPRCASRFKLLTEHGSCPDHPHNAYLQILLEAGILGFLGAMGILVPVLIMGIILSFDRRDPLFRTIAAIAIVLSSGWLTMAYSGNSFWPRDNNQMMWFLMGIILRVWTQRSRMGDGPLFPDDVEPAGLPMMAGSFFPPEPPGGVHDPR